MTEFDPSSCACECFGYSWEHTDHAVADMAEITLGSITTMASNNRSIHVLGHLPTLESRLETTQAFAIGPHIYLAGIHSALSALRSMQIGGIRTICCMLSFMRLDLVRME